MKVTSLKDVESYIYSTVILPLKSLDVDSLDTSSPLLDNIGNVIEIGLSREQVEGEWQHNFQRDMARENAKWLVYLESGQGNFIIADYDVRRHNIRIYEDVFRQLNLNVLLSKFILAFEGNSPFNRVTLTRGMRNNRVSLSAQELERLV